MLSAAYAASAQHALSRRRLTYEFTGWRLFASPRGTMGYAGFEVNMSIELLNIDCLAYMATLPDKAFDLAIVV